MKETTLAEPVTYIFKTLRNSEVSLYFDLYVILMFEKDIGPTIAFADDILHLDMVNIVRCH